MNKIEIIEKIDCHKIISFDLFDTLIKRNVVSPTDIFRIVELDTKCRNFAYDRIEAEEKARKVTINEEVTLQEIYDCLPYDDVKKKYLLGQELETEKKFIVPNAQFLDIYNYAISQKKIVIIATDIYFPKRFVEELLCRNKIEFPSLLYISSVELLKKSTGGLFEKIVKENGFCKKDIVHIGDSYKSDFIRPQLKGISSIHIEKDVNHLLYCNRKKENLSQNILNSFLNNRCRGNHLYQIGFQTIGPFLTGLCYWIHERVINDNIESLLFLSRDGYLMYAVYKKLFPNDSFDYVYASRRSLTVPLLHKEPTLAGILNVVPLYLYTSIYTIIERLGLDYEKYESTISSYGFASDMHFTKDEYLTNPQFNRLFEVLRPDIIKNSKEEYDALKKYINRLKLGNHVGIVDLGWNGTIQKALENFFETENSKISITGLYVGITLDKNNTYGYVFDTKNTQHKMHIMGCKSLLELLLSANHGSLKRYTQLGFDFYDFEFWKSEKTREDYRKICEIQNGAIGFVEELINSECSSYINWSNDIAMQGLLNLGLNPKKKDLVLLGDLSFFDNETFYLAKPQLKKYKSIIKFLKNDFSPAPWKIGYLRRLLLIPLPYLTIYSILRNFSKKI